MEALVCQMEAAQNEAQTARSLQSGESPAIDEGLKAASMKCIRVWHLLNILACAEFDFWSTFVSTFRVCLYFLLFPSAIYSILVKYPSFASFLRVSFQFHAGLFSR